jgi:hypothetical protein
MFSPLVAAERNVSPWFESLSFVLYRHHPQSAAVRELPLARLFPICFSLAVEENPLYASSVIAVALS